MSIFEVNDPAGLIPFSRLGGGSGELYEKEIEELVWNYSEELVGEGLFPVRRQAKVDGGGIPDIVALDNEARVVVIEVKADIERKQIAQCLEYAGWARSTNLDELSQLYYAGEAQFFDDWREFTDGESLRPINPKPRLILVARDFRGRAKSALEFLVDNGLPVSLVTISVYEDADGRRFLDVGGMIDTASAAAGQVGVSQTTTPASRKYTLADLFERGLLIPGDEIIWERPRLGQTFTATITDEGAIQIEDGRVFTSPSGAARAAASIPAYNGWLAWTVVRTGATFIELWEQCDASDAEQLAGEDKL